VATSTLAWGVNTPAHLVIIKGTEYYDAPSRRYVDFPITDVLQVRRQPASSCALCVACMHCLPTPPFFDFSRQQGKSLQQKFCACLRDCRR
jgi:hypothetical protein